MERLTPCRSGPSEPSASTVALLNDGASARIEFIEGDNFRRESVAPEKLEGTELVLTNSAVSHKLIADSPPPRTTLAQS